MSTPERRNGVGLISRRIMVLIGKLTVIVLVVILAAEAPFSVAGLNADGNALLDFKNAITSDPHHALQNWNTSDGTPCLWAGITCANVTIPGFSEERVLMISLVGNELAGTISPRLGDLVYLQVLNLGRNYLRGQIPRELFKALNLTQLNLSSNYLTGDVPAEIRNVIGLQQLVLSENNITSSLPVGLGSNLTKLEKLDLAMNRFTGAIPDDFGDLTTLKETLNLANNHFSGSIPESLANLQNVFIDFSNNNLSGAIPPASYFQSLGATAFAGNAELCGPPLKTDCAPSPSPSAGASSATAAHVSAKKSLSRGAVIGIAVGCGALGLLMATLVLCFFVRKLAIAKKTLTLSRSDNGLRGFLCSWRESSTGQRSGEEDEEDEGDLVHLTGVLSFTLEELLRASAYVLGKNGVGIVYKAVLDEGSVVAVRRLGLGSEHRNKEFEAEVKAIAQVRHPNVVCLHSYSWTVDEKLLIYDYLSNGSLETALHGRSEGSKGPLSWEVRLRIARGVAQGLAHIHECSPRKQYVHGDIKPGNVLLDGFLEPRIADFGLQRLLALAEPVPVTEFGSTRGETSTRSAASAPSSGTLIPVFGRSDSPRGAAQRVAPFLMGVYQAPEAMNAKRPTQKSDVYSFGVVLLELLTGRSPFKQLSGGESDLVSWMRMALQEKKVLSEIFDPYLLKANNEQSKMIETLQVALACIAVNPESRPKMKQVVEFLELQASNS